MHRLIDKLEKEHILEPAEFERLVSEYTPEHLQLLASKADAVRRIHYGNTVYVRGLVEFTNYCKNNCYYCGIRCGNHNASRYRLEPQEILDCCREGYTLGYRTFVLQGGEDPFFTPEKIERLVFDIKQNHPDCAVTLSVGEQDKETYRRWFKAGADRYLLRHETADTAHYRALHPENLTLENRKRCLWDLKEIGYQVGCGLMVGSPHQTPHTIAQDLAFIAQLQPDMVGIGPFIPHKDTPFADFPAGDLSLTLLLLSVVRLMLPQVLLPATTALATLSPDGRKQGILAGANVCMPNLSPTAVRSKYTLYDNKRHTDTEAAEQLQLLKAELDSIGYQVVVHRGDRAQFQKG